ncbi:DnaJ domain-containing protein [Phyllobacterium sp. SYP-B3895]|uniref:DnaJ C-terminal domain-containing protein n=1 Tax=Phyllobacterium sp. SYP-B3895 TaxID=2663240 RepID=UPI001299881A|nr:J domain-containing protein [Phyllobacterium sp. SYP-B3895]MRG54630.1 DnaJ domain-containing protein [Phyllobacterium sp. SYP-B3895]
MASADPYDQLGVARDASQKDIQKAYRRLAKKLHPDLNPGDKEAQGKFQDLSAAYEILSDEEKRARFDRGEIDASGAEQQQQRYYRDFAQAGTGSQRYEDSSGFADFGDASDVFSTFFSQRGRRNFRLRGADRHYQLEVDFLDAVNGASRRITLPGGSTIDVSIPPGTRDGQTLRLEGKGEPGPDGGQAGDALIEIAVRPHPFFNRDGRDIRLDLPISLTEAVLGGKVTVPTPTGPVTATIPKGSNTGKTLRLKGKGIPGRDGRRGDEYLTLQVTLPDPPDAELEAFVSQWAAGRSHNPRRKMGL